MSSMNYVFHKELNIIEVTPEGEINIKDILTYGNELVEKDLMHEGVIEYVDMSNITNLVIDYNSGHKLVSMILAWLENGWVGSVYYTPKEVQYGIMCMLGSIMQVIPNAPENSLIPLREKIPLNQLRDFLTSNKQTGLPLAP